MAMEHSLAVPTGTAVIVYAPGALETSYEVYIILKACSDLSSLLPAVLWERIFASSFLSRTSATDLPEMLTSESPVEIWPFQSPGCTQNSDVFEII